MADGTWSVADAKAHFSALIERARTDGPQHVTRHGKDAVVVVSAAEWALRASPPRGLVEVLLDPAIRGLVEPGDEGVFERDRTHSRVPPTF